MAATLKKLVAGLCFFVPSTPTRFLFRLCGHKIGKNVRIPLFSYVRGDSITIGNDVDIRRFVLIDVGKLSLGAKTIVSYGCQIKGEAAFSCGDNCFLGAHCLIHCVEDIKLGSYSGLGPRCTVYTHGSFLPVTMGYPAKFAPVTIEDYVWIAMEVTIMPGAHIESNCIVNPGVVIEGRVRSGSLVRIDSKQFKIFDLNKLRKIAKRDISYWHNQIIPAFLNAESMVYQLDQKANAYIVAGRYTFISQPEKNRIELVISGHSIAYDLDGFYADRSRESVHKRFLNFIRLRYGISLRTRYT